MLTASADIGVNVQVGREMLKAEDKSLLHVGVELVNKAKNVFIGSSNGMHEKNVNSVPRHLLGLAMEVEGKHPSCMEKDARKRKNTSTANNWLCIILAEVVKLHDISLPTDTPIV